MQCLVLEVSCEVFLAIEIFVPQKKNKILAKNHMQLSWHHKRTHFYTPRMAELKDGKSLKPQPLQHILDPNITGSPVKLVHL